MADKNSSERPSKNMVNFIILTIWWIDEIEDFTFQGLAHYKLKKYFIDFRLLFKIKMLFS